MKPRVRLIHDNEKSPEEVRVIIAPPTKGTKTYDEFNGLIKVEADENTKAVQSIRLDCRQLGGKPYEEALLNFLAWVQMTEDRSMGRRRFPNRIEKALHECRNLCTDKRIQLAIERIHMDRQRKWGNLYAVLDRFDKFNNTGMQEPEGEQAILALVDYVKTLGANWLSVMLELITAIIEDYTSGAGQVGHIGSTIATSAFAALSKEQFFELLKVASKKKFNSKYWNVFMEAVYAIENDNFKRFQIFKDVYYSLLQNNPKADEDDTEIYNRCMILDYSDGAAQDAVISQPDLLEEIKGFYEDIVANDPDNNVRHSASNIIDSLENLLPPPEGNKGYFD